MSIQTFSFCIMLNIQHLILCWNFVDTSIHSFIIAWWSIGRSLNSQTFSFCIMLNIQHLILCWNFVDTSIHSFIIGWWSNGEITHLKVLTCIQIYQIFVNISKNWSTFVSVIDTFVSLDNICGYIKELFYICVCDRNFCVFR